MVAPQKPRRIKTTKGPKATKGDPEREEKTTKAAKATKSDPEHEE
jgi:hypothetical protein